MSDDKIVDLFAERTLLEQTRIAPKEIDRATEAACKQDEDIRQRMHALLDGESEHGEEWDHAQLLAILVEAVDVVLQRTQQLKREGANDAKLIAAILQMGMTGKPPKE